MNITAEQITEIANALGAAAALFVPVPPLSSRLPRVLFPWSTTPAADHPELRREEASVAEQALVAARTVANEKRFGAPPAPHN